MTTRFFVGPIAALFLLCPLAASQQFSHDISFAGLGNGNPAKPFGIAYEPANDRIYVAIAGSFGSENNLVAVIDPRSDAIVATISTGLYPEEIAFAYDVQGNLIYGAVSNSSSGSLTVFDRTNSVLGEVVLPDPFGLGTCYPFGLAWAAASARFFVTTLDGSGDVHAVDPARLTVDAGASLSAAYSGGARAIIHNGALWTSATRYNASFSNADASLARIDLKNGDLHETLLVDETRAFFPGLQDLALLDTGQVIAGGLGFNSLLYRFSPSGQLERTFYLPDASGAHGLAVDASGELLAVCDLYSDTLVLYDLLNDQQLSATKLNTIGLGYGQPNDAVFVHGKLYVTSQATEEVVVFDQLPDPKPGVGYSGTITVSNSTPNAGELVSVTVNGSGLVGLAMAREGNGGNFRGFDLQIGPNATLLGTASAQFNHAMSVPSRPELRGMPIWLQGAVDLAGTPQLTEPRVVVIQ
jgi:YVTN family beta-propeller protein